MNIAFWAWQSHTPRQEDIRLVVETVRAKTLFLRAGQMDYSDERVFRTQNVTGIIPQGIDLHFVYNATPILLKRFSDIDSRNLAGAIVSAYMSDRERASRDGVRIAGLQLDFDVPTRLLPEYDNLLREVRGLVPADTILSITGLPAWLNSGSLSTVLSTVDFWIPQCYGAEIPSTLEREIPISSVDSVRSAVEGARRLRKPFYAGLASYTYAIQYSSKRTLIGLSGDIDPCSVVNNDDLELIERSPFSDPFIGSEWRYVFKARSDSTVGTVVMRAGEYLLLDVPTARSLSACFQAVRERAGPALLGICIFRLPSFDDPTSLTAAEIATSIGEAKTSSVTGVSITTSPAGKDDRSLILTIEGTGYIRSSISPDALVVTLKIIPGSIKSIEAGEGSFPELLCESSEPSLMAPCSSRRAGLLRITCRSWSPGQCFSTIIHLNRKLPALMNVEISVLADDGRRLVENQILTPFDGRSR